MFGCHTIDIIWHIHTHAVAHSGSHLIERKKNQTKTQYRFLSILKHVHGFYYASAYAVSSLNQYYRSLVRWKVFGHNVEVCLFVWLIGWMDGFLFEFVFVLILKRQLTQCMQFQWVMQMQTLASLAMCAFQSACFYRDSSPIRTNRR